MTELTKELEDDQRWDDTFARTTDEQATSHTKEEEVGDDGRVSSHSIVAYNSNR